MAINIGPVAVTAATTSGETPLAVAMPAVVNAGDRIVVVIGETTGTSDVPFTTPAGWTLKGGVYDSGSSQGVRMNVYQKTDPAVGSEDGTTVNFDAPGTDGRMLAFSFTTNANIAELATAQVSSGGVIGSGSVVTSGVRRLVSSFIQRTGSSGVVWTGPDTELVEHSTSNTTMVLSASAEVAAGSYSRTATSSVASSTGAGMILALQEAVVATPPTLQLAKTEGFAVVDARASQAGQGGSLTYAISPATGVYEVEPGLWAVPASSTGPTVYTVTVTESPSGLTDNTPTVTVTQHQANASNVGMLRKRKWSELDQQWQ